jgi:hypothetical protein
MTDRELKYELSEGVLTISIGVDLLVHAVTHQDFWPEEITITNKEKFVEAIMLALQEEEEDGSHPIHHLFDEAAEKAIEYSTPIDPNDFMAEKPK